MDKRTDGIESDWVIRRYIQICILILVTIIVSPLRHLPTIVLICILLVFGYYYIAIPERDRIRERKRREVETAKRTQRALLLKEDGIDHYHGGHYNDAIEILCESVYFNRNDAESLKYLGLSYLTLYKYEDALDCLKRALRINPDDAEVNAQIARI